MRILSGIWIIKGRAVEFLADGLFDYTLGNAHKIVIFGFRA